MLTPFPRRREIALGGTPRVHRAHRGWRLHNSDRRPEGDGTLSWDATTIVVVHAHAGEVKGLGYTYADPSTAKLIASKLAALSRGWQPGHRGVFPLWMALALWATERRRVCAVILICAPLLVFWTYLFVSWTWAA